MEARRAGRTLWRVQVGECHRHASAASTLYTHPAECIKQTYLAQVGSQQLSGARGHEHVACTRFMPTPRCNTSLHEHAACSRFMPTPRCNTSLHEHAACSRFMPTPRCNTSLHAHAARTKLQAHAAHPTLSTSPYDPRFIQRPKLKVLSTGLSCKSSG